MGKNRRRHRKEAHVKAPSSPDSDAAPASPVESAASSGKIVTDAKVVNGADDPGIMLGLEVIDGSKYEVQKEETDGGVVTKVFFKDGDANDNNGEGASAGDADADAAASSGNGDNNDEAEMARLLRSAS
uniref:Uncharacterized protein n=1 Tax=Odontella aurita TaxID=265563 RepID=A0A7S4ICJ9_9STRA|mmetsp:Transcript_23066/g.68036  ORF Transcript_23066/g.68036 Transcript_23066/m.68036 type:complete len:129 (+) Transcript_23066:130-516(+)